MDGRRFRTEAGGRVRKLLRHPHTLSDLSRKVLSFGYFSLHQQRKVTRRRRKPCFDRHEEARRVSPHSEKAPPCHPALAPVPAPANLRRFPHTSIRCAHFSCSPPCCSPATFSPNPPSR